MHQNSYSPGVCFRFTFGINMVTGRYLLSIIDCKVLGKNKQGDAGSYSPAGGGGGDGG